MGPCGPAWSPRASVGPWRAWPALLGPPCRAGPGPGPMKIMFMRRFLFAKNKTKNIQRHGTYKTQNNKTYGFIWIQVSPICQQFQSAHPPVPKGPGPTAMTGRGMNFGNISKGPQIQSSAAQNLRHKFALKIKYIDRNHKFGNATGKT